jgi:hypothetical protein
MTDKSISYQSLIAGCMQQIDIASTILDALKRNDDDTKGNATWNGIKTDIATSFSDIQFMNRKATQDGYTIVSNALPEFRTYYPQLLSIMRDSVLYGRQGWGYASQMLNTQAQLYSKRTLCDLNESIIYEIPQAIIKEKAQEWYLSAYTPANPSEGLIIEQFTRGHMTAAQASYFLGIKGVPSDFAMWLYDSYEKYPTVKELAVASQFIDISDKELLDSMKYSGITLEKNKQFYLNYMHAIQLRTELNNYLAQLKQDYNSGLMSETQFKTEIQAHKPNDEEANQIIVNANHQRTRTLLNMEVQSITWFYRKGLFGEMASDGYAEYTFYNSLIAISIDPLFANAIVRFEASKLGYPFEVA